MNNKFLNILIIVILIIISFLCGIYFCKIMFIKNNNENNINIYNDNLENKNIEIKFEVRDTFVDDNTIIIDNDALENIIITCNKNYNLKLYSINPNSSDFIKDELLFEKYIESNSINIKTLMGEVMPRLYIEIISENDSLKYVPLYNGKDGGYIFKKLN